MLKPGFIGRSAGGRRDEFRLPVPQGNIAGGEVRAKGCARSRHAGFRHEQEKCSATRPPAHRPRRDAAARAPAGLLRRGARGDAARSPRPPTERARDIRDLRAPALGVDRQRRFARSRPAHRRGRRSAAAQRGSWCAIADVDSLVAKDSAIDDHARTNTTSVYTAARIFPMLPEKLSTGPDLAERGRGAAGGRGRHGRFRAEGKCDRGRRLPRERAATTPSSPTTPSRRGSTATGRLRRSSRLSTGSTSSSGSRTARRRRCAASGERKARCGSRPARRARSSRAIRWSTCAPDAQQPRQGADRGLHGRGERRDGALPRGEGFSVAAPRAALAEALGPDRAARRRARRAPAGRRRARTALDAFLERRRRIDPERFPDALAFRRQASGLGRICAWSGRGRRRRRPFRTRGARLRPFDRAESPFPGPDHPAAAEGGACRPAAPHTATRS